MTAALRTRQTCVIGGWTDPVGSRPFFGTLLLGVFEGGVLHYVGQTGAGFTDAELGRVWKRIHALRASACPFSVPPQTTEKAHWLKPVVAADIATTGWTADVRLRNPIFLALREDVDA